MNFRKACAFISAIAMTFTLVSVAPEIDETAVSADSQPVSNDFEVNYDGWIGTGNSILTAENGSGLNGTRGMKITERQSAEEGASSNKGFYIFGGQKYSYSIYVKHDGQNTENFNVTMSYIDKDGNQESEKVLDSKVKSGEWTELSFDYKAPEDSTDITIKVATDSTTDFYFDEFTVTFTGKARNYTVSAASQNLGLKDEFAPYFRVGNILNGGTVKNSAITANIIKDFNSIECENETKPDATLDRSRCNGTDIGVKLDAAAAIFDFCVQNNIAVRGHTLVWHSQTPSWFFKEGFSDNGAWVNTTTMDARLESYIKNMFNAIATQYPGLNLYAYDVCNECISDDSNRTTNGKDGAREAGDSNVTGGTSAWVSVYGNNSFVEKAFRYARQYAPEGCDLYYNDYNEYWDHKRDCIYNMCKSLYDKGLLDGVGMQSHVPANATGFAGTDSYLEAMDKYLSIGCDVQVTELDISVDSGQYSLQDQANKYKAIFQHAMDYNKNPKYNGRVTAVCVWGPNDANSWLKAGSDGLLYDKNNQPKLAYTTLTSMIPQSEWGNGSNPDVGNNNVEPNEYGWYFADGFEGDTCSWSGRGSAKVSTSGRTSYVGDEALLVEGRESAWNGASKSLNPRAFVPGNEYSFSTNVMYFDGDATDTFYLKLQYTDASGETQYSTIAEGTAVKGEWVQLANTNYKIPEGATNMSIYVETAETTNNFYIDEAIGAVGGTSILGAGTNTGTFTLGDVDCNGVIDVLDVSALKHGIMKDFSSGMGKLAADVDQSGTVDSTDVKLLKQYVLREIDKFPVAERPVAPVDTAKMEALFSSITPAASLKKDGNGNMIVSQRFSADPGVMEYNGRFYVYSTNDAFEYDTDGSIKENSYDVCTINCFSSDDMVNWTDHGAIPVARSTGAAKWANFSWAPCAAHKTINGKEKFFLYFANNAGGIGVLTADDPGGPWTDPLGKALITKQTPNCGTVEWLFDPAVLVDDDGTGYLYFGGGVPEGKAANPGTGRVVKLGDDMISLAGDPVELNAPYLFEDSGITKVGNTYYYTYCSNFSTSGNNLGLHDGSIQYCTSSSPMGPFTYRGEFFSNPGNFGADFGGWGNNHHTFATMNGKCYLFYHSRALEYAMGVSKSYRTTMIDTVTVNSDGTLKSVEGTMKGIAQTKTLNPYETVQAETIYRQAGVNVSGLGNTVVTDIDKGDWIGVKGAAFTNGASSVTMRVSSSAGGAIKICTGSENGKAVGYIEVPATGGSFTEVTAPVSGLSGTQDIYFIFSGKMEVDSWSFK